MERVNVPRNDPNYIAARRRIIREHHPDAGGTDAQLIRALKELDEQWDRRAKLRAGFTRNLPSFIPEQTAGQAFDSAERIVERIRVSAEELRRQTNHLQEENPVARRLGRTAGAVRKRIAEEIDKRGK